MKNQIDGWNERFSGLGMKKPEYDVWLDKFKEMLIISKNIPIIDLGCGSYKRFFDLEDIKTFFKEWKIEYSSECSMNRYKEVKIVWEAALRNCK